MAAVVCRHARKVTQVARESSPLYRAAMNGRGTIHRKRCRRYDVPWQAHYLTFSCFLRQAFFRGTQSPLWLIRAVDQARDKCPFQLWAFVIMPEHVHLLVLPGEGVSVSSILYQIKKPVTTWATSWVRSNRASFLAKMADRQPSGKTCHRFWQRGGGYDRNLRSVAEAHEKIVYIHENPVRRGLAARARDWPWSSWRAWEEGVDEPIRIDRQTLPPLES
jgi:putative transposase